MKHPVSVCLWYVQLFSAINFFQLAFGYGVLAHATLFPRTPSVFMKGDEAPSMFG